MGKEEVKKNAEKAMEAIRKDPFVQKYMSNKTKCLKCGNTVFQVVRMAPYQVMLTCNSCGEPHLINADLDEDRAVLTFWSPEMKEEKM